jgi:2-methylcitrate dehydratase PrpD
MNHDDPMMKFIAGKTPRNFPELVIQKAKWLLLDTFGVGSAGARSPACEKIKRLMDDFPMGPVEAVVWGRPEGTSCLWAALANGMAASCLDADDSHRV